MKIEEGVTVKLHYIGKMENGEVFDSTIERNEPLTVNIGKGELIKGVEDALIGMSEGDTKKDVVVNPNEAYGERIESSVQKIPTKQLPKEAKEGDMLQTQGEQGRVMLISVKEINGEEAVIDMNHPLAGKKLMFDLEILETTKSEEEAPSSGEK